MLLATHVINILVGRKARPIVTPYKGAAILIIPKPLAVCALLFIALLMTSVCSATAEVISPRKLLDHYQIQQDFAKGPKVKVVVNLASPISVMASTDFDSPTSSNELRKQIKDVRRRVLTATLGDDVQPRFSFDNIPAFSAEVTAKGLAELQDNPEVVSIESVFVTEAHMAQGIPLMHGSTYRSLYNGTGIAIAICDTGIDYTHARLGGGGFPNNKVIGGYDFGDTDSNPIPNNQAHGTCCAGIAAGDLGTAGDYIGGVAYNAKLYALKISYGNTSSAYSDAMAAAWDWCVTHKNDNPSYPILVISTSFGGNRFYSNTEGDNYYPSMTTAANNARAAGITVLSSSGNEGYCDSIAWPAAISSVISVGAVYDASFGTYYPCVTAQTCAAKVAGGCSTGYYSIDATAADKVPSYSNTASFLTLLAPANKCYTLDITGQKGYSSGDYYDSFGGTSAACPYAAGAVACLQSAASALIGRYLTPQEIRSLLTSEGDIVTDTKVSIAKPRINLENTIQSLLMPPSYAQVDRNNFCPDDTGNINLSVVGGLGATLRWFDDTCGGHTIGIGNPLQIVSPEMTTTYYARWESYLGNSTCASVTVTVKPRPATPTGAIATPSAVYPGQCATLSAQVGSGLVLEWLTDSCNGAVIPGGVSPTVCPSVTTGYYARARDLVTGCVSKCIPIVVMVSIKKQIDTMSVTVTDSVVTYATTGMFYIEDAGRFTGIRVMRTGHGLGEGMHAYVYGTMRTNDDKERYIEATTANRNGTDILILEPLIMNNRDLGGGDWLRTFGSTAGQIGVAGGVGLNNIGLLIRVWGRVTQVGSGYLYIDDGSELLDGTSTGLSANKGIKIICNSASYSTGQYLVVSGISSCFKTPSGSIARQIITRTPSDIVPVITP